MSSPFAAEPCLAMLRRRAIIAIALLALLPFLFARIPPLIDVPGHIGRFGVQMAVPDSPVLHYFAFRWSLVLNLASDLFVAATAPVIGIFRATWLVCALTPVLTSAGIMLIARQRNAGGAHALPWALIFVFNYAFFWGFLNYTFTAGLSLCAFAGWLALAAHPRWRAGLFVLVMPLLLIGHGVGGGLFALWVASDEAWQARAWQPARWRWPLVARLAGRLWPLAPAALLFLFGAHAHGTTKWILARKIEEPLYMLRDQNIVLDMGTVAAALLVFVLGLRWGARLREGAAGPVIATALLFLAAPAILAGADRIDLRLAPFVPMLAFALQDWRGVARPRRRFVFAAGLALLALRFAITTASFAAYDRSYTRELAALAHVAPGSRILNLSMIGCPIRDWRTARTEHLANLATPLRQAWVNAHWANDAINLLRLRYAPPGYAADPSHLIAPEACIDHAVPFDRRGRHGLAETLPRLPLASADYLWLVGARLPPGYGDSRLVRVWRSGDSELYAVRPAR